ncbi:MAG TPA: DUF6263 family protein [Chitinophagaceae bacterium]|nr:DUF6263 family protein [Chitinophagaceae bacterium]
MADLKFASRNTFFLLILLFCRTSLRAQDAIQLGYKFHSGDHYQMSQDTKMDNYQTIRGVSTRVSQETMSTLDFKVTSVSDHSAVMDARFTKLFLTASSNNQKMVINTMTANHDKVNELFKSIIGKPFTVAMESDGTIDSIGGLESIISMVLQGVSDTNDAQQTALRAILNSQVSPEALRSSLQQVLPYYPQAPAIVNQTWENTLQLPGPPAGSLISTWTLTYGDRLAVQLGYSALFSAPDSDQVIPLGGGFNGKISLSGSVQGNYSIDPSTGWPIMGILHTEYQGIYHYLANRKMKLKSNLDVPVRIISDNEIKVLHL